jgi:hypothetical protein
MTVSPGDLADALGDQQFRAVLRSERLGLFDPLLHLGLVVPGLGDVRLSSGSPIATKNSSCPAGVHRQSTCTSRPEAFLNTCGALAGMLTVEPARTVFFRRER